MLTEDSNGNGLIQYFIDVLEAKDPYTQGHSHHVHVVAGAIYERLPYEMKQRVDRSKLMTAALLHDIGKIMTPDGVLNKEGALSGDEWRIMKRHPENGKIILDNTVFREMGDWIMYHHERMDGSGYYGLKGWEIPLESRIIAVADTFSALRTYRAYRPAKSIADTVKIMRDAAGSQLDPEILDYFLTIGEDALESLECNCETCRQRREKAAGSAVTVKQA